MEMRHSLSLPRRRAVSPVSYSSSSTGVATINGSTVTIMGAGTTTITASQSGNSNYLAAANVAQTLTVNQASTTTTVTGPLTGSTNGTLTFTANVTYAGSGAAATGTVSFIDSTLGPFARAVCPAALHHAATQLVREIIR